MDQQYEPLGGNAGGPVPMGVDQNQYEISRFPPEGTTPANQSPNPDFAFKKKRTSSKRSEKDQKTASTKLDSVALTPESDPNQGEMNQLESEQKKTQTTRLPRKGCLRECSLKQLAFLGVFTFATFGLGLVLLSAYLYFGFVSKF